MDLATMRARLRRDLRDEDGANYRWSDDELDRHIARALAEFSGAVPRQMKATIATTSGSREISTASIPGIIHIEAVEYPMGQFPRAYQRHSYWNDVVTLLGEDVPDGSNACIYYGKLHTIDGAASTVPEPLEDLLAQGAEGFALAEWGAFSINRANISGDSAPREFVRQGESRLRQFRQELKHLGRKAKVTASQLYVPAGAVRSETTDWGPG